MSQCIVTSYNLCVDAILDAKALFDCTQCMWWQEEFFLLYIEQASNSSLVFTTGTHSTGSTDPVFASILIQMYSPWGKQSMIWYQNEYQTLNYRVVNTLT